MSLSSSSGQKTVRRYADFSCLSAAAGHEAQSLFLTRGWLVNLWETCLEKQAMLRVYSVEGNARSLLLPMCYQRRRDRFSPRALTAVSNYYTSLFGPLSKGDMGEEDFALLAGAIARDELKWDVIDLQPLDKEAPAFAHLIAGFRTAGMAVQPYFCFGNWYLPVAGRSYAQYFDSLPSRLKNTLLRKSKKLTSEQNCEFRIVEGGEELDRHIDAFNAVYAASWKGREPNAAFVPALIRLAADQGWLRLGLAYIDGIPAAAQLWIVQGGVANIYKLAYDPRFARHSVGSVLTARMMQHVIDVDGVHEVDYLTGDDAYKSEWMSHRRERWGIRAFNLRSLHGCAGVVRHLGGHAIKARLSRIRSGRSP